MITHIIILALISGLIATALTGWEMRRIRKAEGLPAAPAVLRVLDFSIIFLVSILMQVFFLQASLDTQMLAGVLGAFLAAAAWSDAKSGFVPDVAIIPTLITGALLAASIHLAPLTLMFGLWITLGGVLFFALLVLAYLNVERWRITPPDAVFVILIVMTPAGILQMLGTLVFLVLCIILVKTCPHWVRALIPESEQKHLTLQMEEALGMDEGDMVKGGWYPLGPIVLMCVLFGQMLNLFLPQIAF